MALLGYNDLNGRQWVCRGAANENAYVRADKRSVGIAITFSPRPPGPVCNRTSYFTRAIYALGVTVVGDPKVEQRLTGRHLSGIGRLAVND